MRISRLRTLSLVTLGGAVAVGLVALQPVAAQDSCSARTVEGDYALSAQGKTEDLAHTTANLGRVVVDGRGGLSGALTISVDGRIARGQHLSGTYVVNADCTGSETFTIGADPTPRTADFVVSDRGRQIAFLETDPGTVFVGTATRQ
jgi:hypothetical protein